MTGAAHTKAANDNWDHQVQIQLSVQPSGDTLDLGAGNDTVTPGTGADTVTGGTAEADTVIYTGNATAANIEGTGSGTSTGLVVNLGATALSNANILGTTTQSVSGGITSVTEGQVAYLFGASAPTNSTVVDTSDGNREYNLGRRYKLRRG